MPRQHAHLSAHPAGLWALYFWLRLGKEGKKSEGVREGSKGGRTGSDHQGYGSEQREDGGGQQFVSFLQLLFQWPLCPHFQKYILSFCLRLQIVPLSPPVWNLSSSLTQELLQSDRQWG